MIEIKIPGFRNLLLSHLVLDYNGTLATDGELLPGVGDALKEISADLRVHVLTADTFNFAAEQVAGLPLKFVVIPLDFQAEAKLAYVSQIGADSVVAIGNGRNDREMLKAAAIGIALLQKEGGSSETFASADVISASILDALELLRNPKRLIATLRS